MYHVPIVCEVHSVLSLWSLFVSVTFDGVWFLQEIKELQALIDRDKGTEMRDIWKGEMSKAVSELQKEYDNQINQIRLDCESRMESQVSLTHLLSRCYVRHSYLVRLSDTCRLVLYLVRLSDTC